MKKKIWMTGAVIALLLIIYTAVWNNLRDGMYEDYLDGLEHPGGCSYACMDDEGYSFNVKLPKWPGFAGNLCVSSPEGSVSLFIWPGIFGKDEYGIQITGEMDDEISIETSIMTDENGKPKRSISSEEERMLKNSDEELEKLFLKAKKRWNV